MTTQLITHPACLDHDPGPYHPENPRRLEAVLAALGAPVCSSTADSFLNCANEPGAW